MSGVDPLRTFESNLSVGLDLAGVLTELVSGRSLTLAARFRPARLTFRQGPHGG